MPPSCFGGICKLSKVRISDFGRPGLLVLRFRRIMRDHKFRQHLNTSRVNTELRWALPTRSEDPRPLPRPLHPHLVGGGAQACVRASCLPCGPMSDSTCSCKPPSRRALGQQQSQHSASLRRRVARQSLFRISIFQDEGGSIGGS